MADISKEELKKEIQAILKDADLDNTSAKKVRLELQEKLDCDLTDRKKEVDALVMEVIDEQTQEDDEDAEEEEDEEEEEEEEEETKPRKKAAAPKRRAASESGSEEEEEPSDGGGSDYEPDEPVKVNKSRKAPKKKLGSDESSGEEWGGAGGAKKKKKGPSKKRSKGSDDDDDSDYEEPKKKRKTGKNGGGGYCAPVKLSADLVDIVGDEVLPRHEVVKRVWKYIKENNLQDPKNKQFIKCDEKLSKIVPTKKFRGFGMVKFLKDHMNVD